MKTQCMQCTWVTHTYNFCLDGHVFESKENINILYCKGILNNNARRRNTISPSAMEADLAVLRLPQNPVH